MSTLFCWFDWNENTTSVNSIRIITEPRKAYHLYQKGDEIVARMPKYGLWKGVIVETGERKELECEMGRRQKLDEGTTSEPTTTTTQRKRTKATKETEADDEKFREKQRKKELDMKKLKAVNKSLESIIMNRRNDQNPKVETVLTPSTPEIPAPYGSTSQQTAQRSSSPYGLTSQQTAQRPSSPYGSTSQQTVQRSSSPYGSTSQQSAQRPSSPYGSTSQQTVQRSSSPYGSTSQQTVQRSSSPYGSTSQQNAQRPSLPYGSTSQQNYQRSSSPYGSTLQQSTQRPSSPYGLTSQQNLQRSSSPYGSTSQQNVQRPSSPYGLTSQQDSQRPSSPYELTSQQNAQMALPLTQRPYKYNQDYGQSTNAECSYNFMQSSPFESYSYDKYFYQAQYDQYRYSALRSHAEELRVLQEENARLKVENQQLRLAVEKNSTKSGNVTSMEFLLDLGSTLEQEKYNHRNGTDECSEVTADTCSTIDSEENLLSTSEIGNNLNASVHQWEQSETGSS